MQHLFYVFHRFIVVGMSALPVKLPLPIQGQIFSASHLNRDILLTVQNSEQKSEAEDALKLYWEAEIARRANGRAGCQLSAHTMRGWLNPNLISLVRVSSLRLTNPVSNHWRRGTWVTS